MMYAHWLSFWKYVGVYRHSWRYDGWSGCWGNSGGRKVTKLPVVADVAEDVVVLSGVPHYHRCAAVWRHHSKLRYLVG